MQLAERTRRGRKSYVKTTRTNFVTRFNYLTQSFAVLYRLFLRKKTPALSTHTQWKRCALRHYSNRLAISNGKRKCWKNEMRRERDNWKNERKEEDLSRWRVARDGAREHFNFPSSNSGGGSSQLNETTPYDAIAGRICQHQSSHPRSISITKWMVPPLNFTQLDSTKSNQTTNQMNINV